MTVFIKKIQACGIYFKSDDQYKLKGILLVTQNNSLKHRGFSNNMTNCMVKGDFISVENFLFFLHIKSKLDMSHRHYISFVRNFLLMCTLSYKIIQIVSFCKIYKYKI